MKRILRIAAFAIAALLIATALSGCKELSAQEKKLVGKWEHYDTDNAEYGYYIFNGDRTYTASYTSITIEVSSGTFRIKGGKITLTPDNTGKEADTYLITFSEDEKTINIGTQYWTLDYVKDETYVESQPDSSQTDKK